MIYAIKTGDLNRSQRRILEVIERHKDHTWCTSNRDLEELARWAILPSSGSPPTNFEINNEGDLTETTQIKGVKPYFGSRRETTYSLKTVKTALVELASKDRIWAFGLYGRIFYASNKSTSTVKKWLDRLDPGEQERAEFREHIE